MSLWPGNENEEVTEPTLDAQALEAKTGPNSGDAIREYQKDQLHEAFTHVNKGWIKQCETFPSIMKKAQDMQALMKDVGGMKVSDLRADGGLLSELTAKLGKQVSVTDHSLRQLGVYADVPGRYLERLLAVKEYDLFDTNVNAGLKRHEKPEKELFLRFKEGEKSMDLRAILSSRYGVINNAPLIETWADILPEGRCSHLKYDGDTLRMNILVPDTIRQEDDSDYGGGISVLNNETGRFAYRQRPYVFRHICFNGCVYDQFNGKELNRKHLGTIDWKEFRKAVIMNFHRQIPIAQERIEKVLSLKGMPVSEQDIQQAIVYIGQREKFPVQAMQDWYSGFKVELATAKTPKNVLSTFGLVQGLTRSAQVQESIDGQEMMEVLSAKLVESKWDKVLTAARSSVESDDAKAILIPEKK